MKQLITAFALVAAVYAGWARLDGVQQARGTSTASRASVAAAFEARASGVQVTGEGVVSRILPDDTNGSRHQRFILRLASGQTVLVAHNIDLAPRVAALERGDTVGFSGVYEWNAQGGLVHWTHRDPDGRHQAGWLEHAGRRFQ
ncbi:MAG: DUF3465 domain-containing protein [Vicinamibacterales bacterium]